MERFSDLPLVSSLTGRPLWQGGGAGRGEFWRDLWSAGTDSLPHIVAGRGAGASVQLLTRLFGAGIWSHNDFLEFFITGGIVLLAAYLVFLVWVAWSIVRLFRDAPAVSGSPRLLHPARRRVCRVLHPLLREWDGCVRRQCRLCGAHRTHPRHERKPWGTRSWTSRTAQQ